MRVYLIVLVLLITACNQASARYMLKCNVTSDFLGGISSDNWFVEDVSYDTTTGMYLVTNKNGSQWYASPHNCTYHYLGE